MHQMNEPMLRACADGYAQYAHSTPDPDSPNEPPPPHVPPQPPVPDDVPDPVNAPVEEPRLPEPPIRVH